MATQKLETPPDLATQAANWLNLLGGTKTTSSPGDTSALQSTLGQLQGTDYQAMLQAIFNQAGGQIPGLQQALGNAMGARSGGNSAVQAALQKLLASTSTNAMDQVAKLQAQNMQTQANVGANIAQATQGTTKKTGTDVGGGLADAAKLLAIMQGVQKLGIPDMFKDSAKTGAAQTTAAAPVTSTAMQTAAPLASADAPVFDYSLGGAAGASSPFSIGSGFTGADYSLPDTNYSNVGLQAPDTGSAYDYQLGSYDYGLGSGSTADAGLSYTPSYEVADYTTPWDFEADYSFADGGMVKKPDGYADGGTVRAGGSRRSANPSIVPLTPQQSLAGGTAEELRGQFGVQGAGPAGTTATVSNSDIANRLASSGALSSGGSGNGNVSFGGTPGMSPGAFGNAVGKIGAVNSLSGLTGGGTLGPGMGVLGLAGGLANAKDPTDALGKVGTFAANMAAPGLGAAINFGMNPSMPAGINTVASMTPLGAAYNALASLAGFANVGEVAENAMALANPNQAMTPEQQSIQATERSNPNSFGLTSQANAMEGDALGNLMGLTNSFGTGSGGSGNGYGNSGNGGYGGSTGGYGGSYGSGSVGGFVDGGPIDGPGTGTSDSIPTNLSDGEFVISADVVKTLGEDFFNQLQAAFHTPAAMQRNA